MKYFYNIKDLFSILNIYFIPVIKAYWSFSIITAVFSVTWSSEIILIYWFMIKKQFWLISRLKTVVLLCDILSSCIHRHSNPWSQHCWRFSAYTKYIKLERNKCFPSIKVLRTLIDDSKCRFSSVNERVFIFPDILIQIRAVRRFL